MYGAVSRYMNWSTNWSAALGDEGAGASCLGDSGSRVNIVDVLIGGLLRLAISPLCVKEVPDVNVGMKSQVTLRRAKIAFAVKEAPALRA
jgi:hypothetical protein